MNIMPDPTDQTPKVVAPEPFKTITFAPNDVDFASRVNTPTQTPGAHTVYVDSVYTQGLAGTPPVFSSSSEMKDAFMSALGKAAPEKALAIIEDLKHTNGEVGSTEDPKLVFGINFSAHNTQIVKHPNRASVDGWDQSQPKDAQAIVAAPVAVNYSENSVPTGYIIPKDRS
jgi:hypothetical protein